MNGSFLRRFLGRRAAGPPAADPELDRLISAAFPRPGAGGTDTPEQWARLERSIAARAVSPEGENPPPAGAPKMSPRMMPGLVPRYAIGLAVIVVVALLSALQLAKKEARHVVTARGEQSVVTLPDNSEVLLNHTSTLDFDISGFLGDRRVALTGEAFFSVRRTDVPFVVVTSTGSVTVTGTKFNVRVRGGHYEVGVTEGSVRTVVPVSDGDTTIALSAGQAVSGIGNEHFPNVRQIRHAAYPGWNGRTLIFTRMDLWTVCEEVMDYFDVRIRLEDPSLGSLSVTGAFEAGDPRSVITSLCLLTGRQFRYDDNVYIIF